MTIEEQMKAPMAGGRIPRDDQIEVAVEVIRWLQAFEKPNKGVVVEMPTGAGKTLTTMVIVRWLIENHPSMKIGFMVHRRELFKQTYADFSKVLGEEMVNRTEGQTHTKKPNARVRLYMEQTITKKIERNEHYEIEDCDVLFIDECHSMNYRSFLQGIIDRGTACIGLSATPDDHRLLKFWQPKKILGASQEKLEEMGVLVEPTFYTSKPIDEIARAIIESTPDTAKNIEFRTVVKYIIGEMQRVEEKHERHLKWIVKTQKKRQAMMLAEYLKSNGFPSKAFFSGGGGGTKSNIDDILDGKSEHRVAVVVQRFSVGYDHPGIEGIVLTGSMKYSLFVQTVGRALRPGFPRQKDEAYVVDLAGNLVSHLEKYVYRRINPSQYIPNRIVKKKESPDDPIPRGMETLTLEEQSILLHEVMLSHLSQAPKDIKEPHLLAYCAVLSAREVGEGVDEESKKALAKRTGQNYWMLTGKHAGGREKMSRKIGTSRKAMLIWLNRVAMPLAVLQELKSNRRNYAMKKMANPTQYNR